MNENKVQVLLYTSYLHIIGGIETFVINFLDLMGDTVEVGVMCPKLPPEMEQRISKRAKLFTREAFTRCDTLIMIRMMDEIPNCIAYDRSIRMCHACKTNPSWYIKRDCDEIVHVSKASKDSFQTDGKVIYNPLKRTEKKALLFVSATRIPAKDKGENAQRMLQLARMLEKSGIPFLWLNFSDAPLEDAPKGFMNVGTAQDLQPYISKADYLVQLSDHEGFGYSVLEALINKTAVICTPFETTKELGVIDGENGYIIPFDLQFDVQKLLKVPQFDYDYDNEKIKAQWKRLLAKKKSRKKDSSKVFVEVLKKYRDIELKRYLYPGDRVSMTKERAEYLATFEGRWLVKIL